MINPGFSLLRRLLYVQRVVGKVISFLLFGIGSVTLITAVFPVMRLMFHPTERFQQYARSVTSFFMRMFVAIMKFLQVVDIQIDDKATYQNLHSKIIVANHPSLLDVVFLISLIPNADCIVRGALSKHIVGGVIKQLYIPNSLDFDKLTRACSDSLRRGNCLIIFPEGTRTPESATETQPLKKGFARIALACGCGIIPVLIGGNSKRGLKKHDPFFSYNPSEKYMYTFSLQQEIDVCEYADIPVQISVRRISERIKLLFDSVFNF